VSSPVARFWELPLVCELRGQWATNARFRWLLFAVLCIFSFYLILVVDDMRSEAGEAYLRVALREQKLAALAYSEEADFEGYLQEQKATYSVLRERFWLASSEGLAGAELQSWLRRTCDQAGVESLRLDLADLRPVADLEEPVWRLEAELSGMASAEIARKLIGLLDSSNRMIVIERLSLSPMRGDRLIVQVVAYFLIER